MPTISSGMLAYRLKKGVLEVFLVHPGGPFWAKKDLGSWSIPKGLVQGEDLLAAAKREFLEETGFTPADAGIALKPLKQKGGKIIYAWAFEGDFDAAALRSNTFDMEWPPGSGHVKSFPEVDRAGWFAIEEAKQKIVQGQAGFLDDLVLLLS